MSEILLPTIPATLRKINLVAEDFDFPSETTPSRFYAIATTQRSGSSFMACKLWETGVMGAPQEYFNFNETMITLISRLGVDSLHNYVDKLLKIRTSSNGVFGMKIFPEHLQFILLGGIYPFFPDMRYVFLTRKDIVAQAVSYAKAVQTGEWSSHTEAQAEAKYDYIIIGTCVNKIMQGNAFWNNFFRKNNINPIHITYEDIVTDHDTVTKKIMGALEIAPDESALLEIPSISKQTDNINLQWKEKFCSELKKKQPKLAEQICT